MVERAGNRILCPQGRLHHDRAFISHIHEDDPQLGTALVPSQLKTRTFRFALRVPMRSGLQTRLVLDYSR